MKQTFFSILLMFLPMMASAAAIEIDGIYYNLIKKAKIAEVTNHPNGYDGDIVIPTTVIYDGDDYCVTTIDENAFYECTNLTSISIPNSVTKINSWSFGYCTGLTSITIPNSVTKIGSVAFYQCSGLSKVEIGSSVTEIGNGAFENCSSISSIIIPNSVTELASNVFEGCTGLTSITIPQSVTKIGSKAFFRCSGLSKVEIGDSVTEIGSAAFYCCTGLTSITIPNSVTKIGGNAFCGCQSLTSAILGNGITEIKGGSFFGCSSLASITIPDNVNKIEMEAFSGCTSLTSITIPNNVAYIDLGAFSGCTNLTTVIIGNGMTSIESDTFEGCTSLSTVIIGNKVSFIDGAFTNCSELKDVFCYAESVPDISVYTFMNSYIEYATLHVPETSVELYKSADYWKDFKNIVKIDKGDGVCLDKSEVVVRKNKTVTLTPIVFPSTLDDKSVTWKSSDKTIATVSSSGKVKGIKSGMVTITCTSNATGAKATCKVTVGTITLNKSEVVVRKKSSVTLKPTVYPTILEDRSVTWKSSDESVAMVSSSGKVTGVKSGVVTITCISNATGLSTTCKVTVGTITLNKSEVIVRKKKSVTLKPTVYPTTLEDKSVTWKSSDETIATVSSSGKVTGVKSGIVTITCTSNATSLSTTCKVTVGTITLNKSEVIVRKKKSVTLTPTVYPTSLEDKSVTWKSSDESIATVSSDGVVTGIKSGVITITCTSNATGLSATCKVTVATIALSKSSATITVGKTVTLKPTVYPLTLEDQSVTWKSSNKAVATVTSAGKVKGIAAGTATITCTAVATGVSTTCKVTVKAVSARILDGDDDELTDIEIAEVASAAEEPFDVYDLKGHCVLHQVTSLDGLPAGVYIVNGKKVLKK